MLEHIWVIPAITFVSFWIILFFGKKLPFKGSEVGLFAVGATLVLSVVAGAQWVDRPADYTGEEHGGGTEHVEESDHVEETDHSVEVEEEEHALQLIAEEEGGGHAAEGEEEEHHEPVRTSVRSERTWFEIGGIEIKAGTHVDGLTIVMLFVVALISFLVHVFSTNYMHGDARFTHFFAGLSLFTTGMYVLVTASGTLQALFGWELMGLCSFMLIGHWWEDQKNSDAALKAFFTTRTGDIGLLVGISILFFTAGQTFDIATINSAALGGRIGETALLLAAFALLLAVIGKSAQFPLH